MVTQTLIVKSPFKTYESYNLKLVTLKYMRNADKPLQFYLK